MVRAWRMTSERVKLCFFASLSTSSTILSGKRTLMISNRTHCSTIVALEDFMLCPETTELGKAITKKKKLVLAEKEEYSAEACPTEWGLPMMEVEVSVAYYGVGVAWGIWCICRY